MMVNKLITNGAEVNLPNCYEHKTPLMVACEQGDIDIFVALLNASADINTSTMTGENALWYAQKNSHPHITTLLYSLKANINLGDLLLRKLSQYLKSLLKMYPEQYNLIDNPAHYQEQFEAGLCTGYAYSCLILHDANKVQQFHNDLRCFSEWSDQREPNKLNLPHESARNIIAMLVKLQHINPLSPNPVRFITADPYHNSGNTSYQSVSTAGFLFKKEELNAFLSVVFNCTTQVFISNDNHGISIKRSNDNFIIYNIASPSGPIVNTDLTQLCQYINHVLGAGESMVGLRFDFIQSSVTPIVSDRPIRSHLSHLVQKRTKEHQLNMRDKFGANALYYAITPGNDDVVINLLEHGILTNTNRLSTHLPIIFISMQYRLHNISIILCLANADIHTPFEGITPLMKSIAIGDMVTTKLLITHHVATNYVYPGLQDVALDLATQQGNIELAMLLRFKTANIGQVALYLAINAGYLDLVNILYKKGVSLTKAHAGLGFTPLHFATIKQKQEIIDYIKIRIAAKNLEKESIFFSERVLLQDYTTQEKNLIQNLTRR